jgi:hypothetical protein
VLAIRQSAIVPCLPQIRSGGRYYVVGNGAVVARWFVGTAGKELMLAANLSDAIVEGFPPATGRVLWREGEPDQDTGQFGPWSVRWTLSDMADGGDKEAGTRG